MSTRLQSRPCGLQREWVGATLQAEDRHHFWKWHSLIWQNINGCIWLLAPRFKKLCLNYSFSRMFFWKIIKSSRGRGRTSLGFKRLYSVPSSTPAARESLNKLFQPACFLVHPVKQRLQALCQKLSGQYA